MNMKSGELKITEHGKIVIAGELFEERETNPTAVPFEGFVDTGCTYDLVIPKNMANAVCAQIEEETGVSVGGGSSAIKGTIRKVNIRLGSLVGKNVTAFVPDTQSNRFLIGIGLLQKINAFLAIDFHSGSTQGCILTNDRGIPFIVGKVLHYHFVHHKEIVPQGPCEFC